MKKNHYFSKLFTSLLNAHGAEVTGVAADPEVPVDRELRDARQVLALVAEGVRGDDAEVAAHHHAELAVAVDSDEEELPRPRHVLRDQHPHGGVELLRLGLS